MYAEYFSLRELPFNNTPDPRFFFSTPDHEEALASLVYAVKERKGFVLLTGEVGAGKTLISRMMLRQFNTSIAFATINHAVENARDLMESVCAEFDIEVDADTTQTQLVRLLHDFLLARFAQNIPVVLVLDEAQNLPTEAFEQLRMIGNLESDDAKLLQIAIVGQPELQQKFASSDLRQLRQRIFRIFHLPALDREATGAYICHRLDVAGAQGKEIFTSIAIDRIFDISRGLPRIINTVCDNALLSGYSSQRKVIDGEYIESVVQQMMLVGTFEHQTMQYPQVGPLRTAPREAVQIKRTTAPVKHTESQSPFYPTTPESRHPAIESLAGRVKQIQAQLNASLVGESNSASPLDEKSKSVQGEGMTFKQTLMSNPDEVYHRLSLLERKYHATTSAVADARSMHTSLEPLLRDAQSIVTQASTTVAELKQRDEQLRKSSGSADYTIQELKRLLDRYELATARSKRDGRNAQEIYDRLVSQAQKSRTIMEDLRQFYSRADSTVA